MDVFHIGCFGEVNVIHAVSIGGEAKSVVGDEVHFISVTAGVSACISTSVSAVTTATLIGRVVFGVEIDEQVGDVFAFVRPIYQINTKVAFFVVIPSVTIFIDVSAGKSVSSLHKGCTICIKFCFGIAIGAEVDVCAVVVTADHHIVFVIGEEGDGFTDQVCQHINFVRSESGVGFA